MATVAPESVSLDADALERLAGAIQSDIDAGRNYGASVLVARGGQIAFRRTFGTVGPDRPAADTDRYLLMSMSKAFTAALVLRAVDEGRFSLDTRVADLVPGFVGGGKQRATVRQLLCHTAGLPFALVPPPLGPAQIGDLPAKTAAISALPAIYTPGTRCLYTSGVGYDLLGQILVLTDSGDRDFRRLAREDLFEPLGLSASSFGLPLDDPTRVPVSQTPLNGGAANPFLAVLDRGLDENSEIPSGNAYATIDDVFRFTELIRGRGTAFGRRILSPALFDYASGNHTDGMLNDAFIAEVEARGLDPVPANFTLLGGYVRGSGHVLNPAGHTASAGALTAVGGASTGWMIDPERDLTVVFLSAGFVEGLAHLERLQRLNDLALAAVD